MVVPKKNHATVNLLYHIHYHSCLKTLQPLNKKLFVANVKMLYVVQQIDGQQLYLPHISGRTHSGINISGGTRTTVGSSSIFFNISAIFQTSNVLLLRDEMILEF